MEKRKFSILVYKDYDWELGLEGIENFDDFAYLGGDKDYGFAHSSATKDKKIAYLFDSTVNDEDLEKVKDDERFQEVCDFRTTKVHKDDTETKSTFTGTFIEALESIKKALNDK